MPIMTSRANSASQTTTLRNSIHSGSVCPVVSTPSVMVNLIGTAVNQQWLALPLVHLHWYEKEVREGRKVGHLNLNDPDAGALQQALQALAPLLPAEYQSGLAWAQQKLA